MISKEIGDWLREYTDGFRASNEMVCLIFERLTFHPEEREEVFELLQSCADPQVRKVAYGITELIAKQESRAGTSWEG